MTGPQHIVRLRKTGEGIAREELIAVRFVPLLPGQAKECERIVNKGIVNQDTKPMACALR